ncbi:bifunctional YncE family protein/alkaline phosphatase family protein [Streptantibioticus ferralitis]|uniref:Bifunctional YncE family protein/alkaline phosphatase family protein n=1 Tax=Streptantibioticus ferralitis TaxID=236510 RepID=A0ABT5YZJ0_9ACTN|nr:bifunctional YncE family protein/alkaline phosphatase family protein [Streptantibioticus ferralitis]MDF2256908.1 bifunctional YncE family protein/alkaline phosphatase family protein [Streptantibioticus ferralitis]
MRKPHSTFRRARSRGLRGTTTAALTVTVVLGVTAGATAVGACGGFGTDKVDGEQTAKGILLPSNQRVTPLGTRHLVDNGRLLSSTLSPDGRKLAALTYKQGTGFLTIMDVATGNIVQQIGTGVGTDKRIGDGKVAADGPLYSPDGRSLWFPQASDLVRFSLDADGKVTAAAPTVIPLTGKNGADLPSGMALSQDGRTLYTALNGSNTLGVIDTTANALVKEIPVGIAPRQVVVSGNEAYVSNEGGRPAGAGDNTNLTDGTPVVADRRNGAVTNGTVSVVDLGTQTQSSTIKVGLEPTALTLHGGSLLVANSNDDSVSVIDTRARRVTQTFNVNPLPGSSVGSYPNAFAFTDPHTLLVSVGRDNALVRYHWDGGRAPVQYQGLIPTDWYPVNVQRSNATGRIVVTNDKGIGTRGAPSTISEGPGTNPATGHNTYNDTGSITTFRQPSEAALGKLTHQVFVNNDWEKLLRGGSSYGSAKDRAGVIPAHLGSPSKIKHVFLIDKENRTYDQVLGDVGKGDGNPSLAQFGKGVTPNLHALANTYGVMDNFYDIGTLSADGHNWLVQADANDYIEKEFGAFYRSYPALGNDALAYQRSGFLWNTVQRAGKTAEDFSEYAGNIALPATGAPTWAQWYHDSQVLEGKASGPLNTPIGKYPTTSDVPSVNAINHSDYPTFDTDIPDQYRVDIWQRHFADSVKSGKLANLTMIQLPQDHTNGISGKDPYPTAMAADNDLAVGRIIDTISHSRFWKDSAVFILEDDSQNGVDHVDGHRAPLWVVSPYAKRNAVVSTYYSQVNVVKTIEQILGAQPMNQVDRAAEPMYDLFTEHPDFTPYTALSNQVPLDYGLKPAVGTADAKSTAAGTEAGNVPQRFKDIAQQWQAWSAMQQTGGSKPKLDQVNPAQLNRIDWYAATGWTRPYPGDQRILAPNEVPGRDTPPQELGGQ